MVPILEPYPQAVAKAVRGLLREYEQGAATKLVAKVHSEARTRAAGEVKDVAKELKTEYVQKKKADFAPGIPAKVVSPMREIGKENPNETWILSLQKHDARKAGRHYDLSLVDPETSEAHRWALPAKKWPGPGERVLAIRQPTHTGSYALKPGKWKLGPGYGEGAVKSEFVEPVEVMEIGEAGRKRAEFYRYGPGQQVERYTVVTTPRGDLLVNNSDSSRQVGGARGYVVPSDKPKFRETSFDTVDPTDDTEIMRAKIDGAHVVVGLQSGKPARVFSYRESKRQPVIEHTQKFPDWFRRIVPPGLGGTVLRAELWGSDRYGRAIAPQELGALLNTDVWKSRIKQEENGIKLRLSALDVSRHAGRPSDGLSRDRRAEILRQASGDLEWLELPPEARTAAEKRRMLRRIASGGMKETSEGVVLVPERGTPIKAKITPEHDAQIVGTFPGKGKYEGVAIGGFLARDEQGVVNRVGTGLTDALRRRAAEDPKLFKGMVAKVVSRGRFPGGKLRDPRFKGFHLDKNDPERLEAIVKKGFDLEAAESRQPAVAGLVAAEVTRRSLGEAGVHPLSDWLNRRFREIKVPGETTTELQRKLMKTMGKKKLEIALGGKDRGAYFRPRGLGGTLLGRIVGPKNISPSTFAHELGHATSPMIGGPRGAQVVKLVRGLGKAAPIAGGLAAALLPIDDKDYAKYSPLVGAAGAAPTLVEEAQASIRGMRALERVGVPKSVLRAGRKSLARAFATYLRPAAYAVGLPSGVYGLRRLAKKLIEQKKEKEKTGGIKLPKMMRTRSWAKVVRAVIGKPAHSKIKVYKEGIPHPKNSGFERGVMGWPRGQKSDWRAQIGGKSIHAREYPGYWEVHRDRVHPKGILGMIGHFYADLPKVSVPMTLGVGVGTPAVFMANTYLGKRKKEAQAWKRKLLTGEIKKEVGRLSPLIKKMQEKLLPGLERGNVRLRQQLESRGWKFKPGKEIYTDAVKMEVKMPASFSAPIKKNKGRRLVDNLWLRHEVDEARLGEQLVKKEIGMPLDKLTANQRAVFFNAPRTSIFFSHRSPEVIRRESVLASQSPPHVRKFLQEVRGRGGEAEALKQVGEYGRHTPMGKKQIKEWLRSVKPGLKKEQP